MYKHIKEGNLEFYDLALLLSEGHTKDVFCDIETTGLDPRKDKILSLQVMAQNDIFIYDFIHLNNEHLAYIVNLLENSKVKSTFFNTKFDIKFLFHNTGIMLSNVFDCMNAEVLLNAGRGKSLYSLADLVLKYEGEVLDKEVREQFWKQEVKEFSAQQLLYAAKDVKVLSEIYTNQMQQIIEAKEQKIADIEMKLLPVVAKMEYDGILLDTDAWLALEKTEAARVEETGKYLVDFFFDKINYSSYSNALQLSDAVRLPIKTKRDRGALEKIDDVKSSLSFIKEKFNLGSKQQVLAVLNLLGVECENTNEKELVKFAKEHAVVDKLIEFREAEKRVNNYGANFLNIINPVSGRIHTEFLNMGAATGRFSSNNPNLQNIPRAKGYRESFIASPDFDFLSHDYSQQEYRLAGAVSGEPVIIDAYLQGADMHTATAANFYNKAFDDVTPAERNWGKTRNFEIIYGTTEWGLSKSLKCSIDEAKEVLKKYWAGYPTLSAFKLAVEDSIVKLGYSITPYGRKRYNVEKPLYMTGPEYMRYLGRIKREGFNHIIQGGGADIVKIAMINIYNNNPFGDKFRMLLTVHDEIDSEAHKSISKDAEMFVKEEMEKAEQPLLGDIPAKVDSKILTHWSK